MDSIRKAFAVMVKDLRVVSQDRGYLISMLLFPILISLITSASFGGSSQGISLPVALSNQDSGEYGASIVHILEGIKELRLANLDSPDAAQAKVTGGETLAAVLIPADFSKRIADYQPAEIIIILDPAQASYGRILTGILDEISSALAIQGEIRYGIRQVLAGAGVDLETNPDLSRAAQAQVEGVIFTQIGRMESDAPIQVQKEVISGRQVLTWNNMADLMLPSLMVMFAFFITAAVSTDLIHEREAGALRRLVAAPLPRGSLIGGKILAYTLVVILQVIILLVIGVALLDMSLGSSPVGLIVTTLSLGLVATSLGMMIAALSRSAEQAGGISLLLIFVLGYLGGCFTPQMAFYRHDEMGIIAILSRFTPQAQASIAYQTLILQGGGLIDILPQIAYLLGLSLLFFLVAIWRFKFDA